MSSLILNFEDYQNWEVKEPKCLVCYYKWVAVLSEKTNATTLECPKCSNQKTISVI